MRNDFNDRLKLACEEYGLDYFENDIVWKFISFRHLSQEKRDKILNEFRNQYPMLYSILIEVEMLDES